MVIPLVSIAQVRILSEGIVQPWLPCDRLPAELAPKTAFTVEQIRRGLPPAKAFGLEDLRCCHRRALQPSRRHRAFFELP